LTIKLRAVFLIELDESKILKEYVEPFGQERIDLLNKDSFSTVPSDDDQAELVQIVRDAIFNKTHGADIANKIELSCITREDGMINLLKTNMKF
jgi:hypothetical protein